jgi:hypothetical protein
MRSFRFAVAFAAAVVLAAPAAAETRIFLLDGNDGYGIDRCLIAGEQCGRAAAQSICEARQYAQVVNFGRLDPKEITGAVPERARLPRPQTVAITCAR